ncbi:MAG: cupin domain-containing protein [Phycisphaerales bacterium]|nr:MAG: cupin domain-containing protein [Phycisphaerales bacterium]
MFVRSLDDCHEFVAGDDSLLREILHPDKAVLDIRYSLAHATVLPGQTTRRHRLATAEVYYVIQGTGEMIIDEQSEPVHAGDTVYIPPGAVQSIANTGAEELVFLCIVDPAWQPQDEEILDK